MMHRLTALTTIVLCGVAGLGRADEPVTLSLKDCLQRAVRSHPLLAAAQHDVEVAEADAAAMRAKLYPSVSALVLTGPTPAAKGDAVTSTTPVNDYGYLLKNLGPFFHAELTVTQPLYTFGKVAAGEAALTELIGVRERQVDAQRWEVVTQVKSVYYGLLLVRDLLALTDEVQGYVDQAKGYLEEHLKNEDADVTPIDRAKLTTYAAELKTQRIELKSRERILTDALLRLVGAEPSAVVKLGEESLETVDVPELSTDALLAKALAGHPELAAAEHGTRALSLKRDATRAGYLPDLFVAGRARYGVAPNREQQKSPFAKDDFNFLDAGIALGLRYDLTLGVTSAELAKVTAELEALDDKRRALGERVSHDVLAALSDWHAASDKIGATKEGFKAARAWCAFAQDGFELGTVSAKELIDALGAFVKARFALLQVIYEYNVAVARLSTAAGQEVVPELSSNGW